MERRYLVLSVVVILHVHSSLQDCRIVQTANNSKNYWCNTIQELEDHGNPQLLDVNVYNGKTLPIALNQTQSKIPHLQIVFTDDTGQGLSPNTYTVLKYLRTIVSKNNPPLSTISKGLFDNLPLQKLHLNDNGIQSIQVGAFSNMPNLQELYITHNNLKSIEPGIFNSLVIDTLSLSNNKISVIRKNALFNMKNLKHLHLDGNSLSEFRPDLFLSYGSNLKTLLLQGNYLTEFDRTTVKSLDNLKVLNLGSNSISRIVIYAFENLLNLEELNLAFNQLQELNADVFAVEGMHSLKKLEINDNRLSFLSPKLLGRLNELKHIRLGGNPWMCPCFDAIVKWLNDKNVKQFCDDDYFTGKRPICVVPDIGSTACDYTTTAVQFINRYADTNAHDDDNKMCSL